MLYILISWVYIFITTLNFGFLFKKIFGIKSYNFTIHHILGLFLYTITITLFSFFYRIHYEFYLGILIINLFSIYHFKKDIKQHVLNLVQSIKSLHYNYRILLISLCIITLAQSATKPYLIDNESYYIQTIKWVNEYGLVKGLANLHMFFGFYSGWHILQSGFNFPFINDLFNDLNGYLLIFYSVFAFQKLDGYEKSKIKADLFIGSVLIFSLFFMQFINAPSPDLAIFLISQIVFYLFLVEGTNMKADNFLILLCFILFLCFIKVTAVALVIIPIYIFIKNYTSLKKDLLKCTILCSVLLLFFLIKNLIITGYLIYPFDVFNINVDWKQPKELIDLYKHGTFISAFDNVEVDHLNLFERFFAWLNTAKLHGVFNKLYILLLFFFPIIIYRSKQKLEIGIVYFLAVLQLIIVWNSSAQYRYYFAFLIFLFVFGMVSILKTKRVYNIMITLSIYSCLIPLIFNISIKTLSSNAFAMELSQFKLSNIIIPEGKSKYNIQFTKESINGFNYNSPDDTMFFWGTGNGELPCVNKKQLEYIKTYYHYTPALRSGKLKDGFKTVKTNF